MKKISYIVLLAVMVLMVCGCRRQPGPAVMQLYELTDTAPAQALAGLDSLTTANLSEAERRLADFVRLKASDKVYITHTSDSTILALLDYYEDDDRFGSEVLYYAGRVYSDLGDYPTALTYFQKALQATPTEKNLRLRSAIASQTGRLLNTLKLHNQAIPYLKETLKINALLADTVNLMYNHQLLGDIYMRAGKIDSAEIVLKKGMEWAKFLTEEETSLINSYFAHIAYMKGDYTQALNLIRGVPEKQEPKFRNLPLLYATQIYRANGELDSAYCYVEELIHSNYYKNRCAGFEELFSTQLKELVPKDSLASYMTVYNRLLDYAAANNSAESAIFQNSYFNYNDHLIKRIEAESQKNKMINYAYGFALLILILVVIVFIQKIRYQKSQIELLKALDDIRKLNLLLSNSKQQYEELQRKNQEEFSNTPQQEPGNSKSDQTKDALMHNDSFIDNEVKERLKSELLQLSKLTQQNDDINKITESAVYKKLVELLKRNQSLSFDNPLWEELEQVILCVSPQFKNKFQLILGAPLSKVDLQTMMLIKSGFRNSDIAVLSGRSSSAISERRRSLCSRLFGKKVGIEMFNNIICNL